MYLILFTFTFILGVRTFKVYSENEKMKDATSM